VSTATAPSPAPALEPVSDLVQQAELGEDDLGGGRPDRNWRPIAWCIGAYVALSLLIFFPMGPLDSRHLPLAGAGNPAGNDPYQMTWFLSYVPYALTHGLSIFHTNYIDYPSGVNLADNTSVPLLGILGWPITATLGPIAAFNFLVRLSFALSGVSMFLVLRRWCKSWQAPFIGGLLYAFGPYMASQELHLDLIFVPIPPLLVLFGDEMVRRQRMSPWLLGLLIGAAAAVQYVTSPDVLSGCVALALIVAVGLAIRFRALIAERAAYILKSAVVAGGSFVVLAGYPIYEMLLGPGRISGPVVQVSLLQSARADLFGLVAPTSNQLLVPRFVSFIGDYFVGGNLSENGTYLGIPLLIVLFVVARRLRRDPMVMTMVFGGLSAWVLSLGAHLSIGTWPSPIPLPGDLLAHLPLFDNTIPARYALYVLLSASFVVAIGVDRIWLPLVAGGAGTDPIGQRAARTARLALSRPLYAIRALPQRVVRQVRNAGPSLRHGLKRPWSMRKKVLVLGGVVALSLLPNAPFADRTVPWSAALPGTIENVVRPGTIVLSVPFATPTSSEAMSWQAIDHMEFRIVGGYANIAVPGTDHGQRQPLPLPPSHVQEILSIPKLGGLFPYIPPKTAEYQLLVYLHRYSIGAIVFSVMGAYTSEGYWYLLDTLGQPQIVRPGFAIWLPTDGRWLTHPVG
jgi:hypothetical protein